GKADHLSRDEPVAAGLDHDARADAHGVDRAGDLHHQPAHADDAAIDVDAVEVADLLGQRLQGLAFMLRPSSQNLASQNLDCETLKFRRVWPDRLTSCLPASLIITSLSLVTECARPPEEGRVARVC